jgi:hypothetical protein
MSVARSTFGRLFTYARESSVDALENFTTEALAAAIQDDPSPLLQVLRSMRVIPATEGPTDVVAETQVGVRGVGILDLVVVLRDNGKPVEIWIEVKVMAGESGNQLEHYRAHLAALPVEQRPTLVTLAKAPVGHAHELPWISWQSIWRAARAADHSTHWRDLRSFLEEIGMADAFDAPVSAAEAASLDGAVGLFGKTRRILGAAAREANTRWPAFRWPADDRRILGMLSGQFGRHRRYLIVAGEEYRAYLFMGVTAFDGEAHATVWVETRNKAIDPRRQIIAAADAGGLSDEWERDMGAWGGLHKRKRLVALGAHAEVAGWLIGALEELASAGVLDLIPSLGRAEAIEAADDDADPGV